MKELFFRFVRDRKRLCAALCAVFLILALILLLLLLPKGEENPNQTLPVFKETSPVLKESIPTLTTDCTEEPISEEKETLPVSDEVPLRKEALAHGIDVSKWQGKIDWKKVKAAGVDFAMIRLGYRGGDGKLYEDETALYNLKESTENGVLAGVYFYSGAKSPEEAREEAEWVLSRIQVFAVSYPVVLDHEKGKDLSDYIPPRARTDAALAFLNHIRDAGYGAMLYAPQSEFETPLLWESDRILSQFPVWIARYSTPSYPEIGYLETENDYAMWQYSDQGKVDGIRGNVDLNVAYFTCCYAPPKKENTKPEDIDEPDDFRQTFSPEKRRVTAKILVNLRKLPSIDGEVVGELKNGEYLLCTGIGDMGWSRLEYNGESVYAVTSYLTFEES